MVRRNKLKHEKEKTLVEIVSDNPKLQNLLKPKSTKYIPIVLTPKQEAFLLLNNLEAFYGGAAGGGKSYALLAAALQYVDVPGYNALLLRDTYSNLSKPKALMYLAHEWLQNTDARWRGDIKTYEFPTTGLPATLSFGYLDSPLDHFQYLSASYHFVGIDEVVNIREHQALYMFSRMRKDIDTDVPIRFRSASNPPTREQLERGAWVKDRYINPKTRVKGAVFIPAQIKDNKHLDKDNYDKSLDKLDPITRKQLKEGDWDVKVSGNMFKRHWFPIVETAPNRIKWTRYWDLAATEEDTNKKPAYTVGVKMGMTPDGLCFVDDVRRERLSPMHVEQLVQRTAFADGRHISIYMEQEPGSSGKAIISHYRRNLLKGFVFRGDAVNKSKSIRHAPYASQAEAGNIILIQGQWNKKFLDEHELYGPFLDQIDSASGAYLKLCGIGSGIQPRIATVG